MAGPRISRPGPVNPSGDVGVVVTPPTIDDYDLDRLFPPIDNSPLPDPEVLGRTAKVEPRELTMRGAKRGDPEPRIYGKCLADPDLIAADDDGTYLYIDLLWSDGECDYIEGLFVEGVNEGRADFLGHVQHFEGTVGQGVSTIMDAEKGGDYDELDSKCHTVARWRNGWSLQIQGGIRGLKLYDPRVDDFVYSTNAALALADVLVATGRTMNWDSVVTPANRCDDDLGGGALRWQIGGQVKERHSANDWIQTFAAHASCFVDRIGAETFLIADMPRSPNHTVDVADDAVEGTVKVYRSGGSEVPETVTVVGREFVEIADTNDVVQSGSIREISYTYPPDTPTSVGTHTHLPMPFFQTVHACGRKAEEVWRKARSDLTLEFIGFDVGIRHTIGDLAVVTAERFGIVELEMALIQNTEVERGRWHKKYVQYDENNYSDVVYTADDEDTTFLNPYLPPEGPAPTLTEEAYTDPLGDPQKKITIEWTGVTYPYVDEYHVKVVADDDIGTILFETYVPHTGPGDAHVVYAGPTVIGVTYTVTIKIKSNVLYEGPVGTADIIIAGILFDDAPIVAYMFDYSGGSLDATLTWINNLSTFPNATRFGWMVGDFIEAFVPAIDHVYGGAGDHYIFKYDVVSTVTGDPSTAIEVGGLDGEEGIWHALPDGIAVEDDVADGTVQHFHITVTVAKDTSAGALANLDPVPGTEVAKPVEILTYRGSAADYILRDLFTGVAATNLTAHAPDNGGLTWVAHAGTIQLNGSGRAVASGTADNRYVVNAGVDDACIRMEVRINSATCGLIARAVDASNYWMLQLSAAGSADPLLELIEVVAGTPTVRDSTTFTGKGPFSSTGDSHLIIMTDGDDIYGDLIYALNTWHPDDYQLHFNSSQFNTATLFGLYLPTATPTVDLLRITTKEIGLLT